MHPANLIEIFYNILRLCEGKNAKYELLKKGRPQGKLGRNRCKSKHFDGSIIKMRKPAKQHMTTNNNSKFAGSRLLEPVIVDMIFNDIVYWLLFPPKNLHHFDFETL